VVGSTLLLLVVGAPAASADSAYNCPYPYVCIYGGDGSVKAPIIGHYRDFTNSWQYLRHPQTGYGLYNTRNDDVVYVMESSPSGRYQRTYCIKPGGSVGSIDTLRAIMIRPNSTC
jgi:hypothetical protein